MITNDEGIVHLKHTILEEVARLAWDDNLTPEAKDALVYKIIPGPIAKYRCCIYKEREIVRQRIRLAEGLCPTAVPEYQSDNGESPARAPAISARSPSDITDPISIPRNVRSAENAPRPVLTPPSPIWSAPARRRVLREPSPMMRTASA